MINIKYITNVRLPTPRAQGYAIMKMCEQFAKTGINLELFIPNKKDTEFTGKDPFDFYNIEKNFKIKKIPSFDLLGKTFKFGKVFYWLDTFLFLIVSKFIVKIGKDDVLYTRDFTALLFYRNNIIFELHNIPRSKFLFNIILKIPKFFIVISNGLKYELIKLGVDSRKIYVFPSGVDLDEFDIDVSKDDARKKANIITDKKVVMYTGHLYAWKGADILAQVAPFLPEAVFVFVGGIDADLDKFKEKYGMNVKLVPKQPRSLIPFYLKSADVLVLPNSATEKISSRYTSPLKLFEYMASKRPIVASDLPSLKEVLNEKNGLFAKADDVQSFTQTIKKLIYDEKLSSDISSQAFEDVQKYTWQKRAESILSIIK